MSRDGSLAQLDTQLLLGRLEELQIPRDQHPFARALQSWQRAGIPPDVALAIWLLRESQALDGRFYRRPDLTVQECGPTIRYIQLAALAGERWDTDPWLRRGVGWLTDQQLDDGSMPDLVSIGRGEVGTSARVLHVLRLVDRPELDKHIAAIQEYLESSAVQFETDMAWFSTTEDSVPSIGSTSLAVTTLVEGGSRSPAVTGALRFLLAAQSSRGGWPDYSPHQLETCQSTFNALRALWSAQAAGLVRSEELEVPTEKARQWFIDRTRDHGRWLTTEVAFGLRLAGLLNVLHLPAAKRLGLTIRRRRRQSLDRSSDLYGQTEIGALALLETARRLEKQAAPGWTWLWQLPATPPPFLRKEAYFYDLLYGAMRSKSWVRVVDFLSRYLVVERGTGLLLGMIIALGIVDERISRAVTARLLDARTLTMIASVAALTLLWLALKFTARTEASANLWSSVAALIAAVGLVWIVNGSDLHPAVLPLVALYWLIIDIVSFTADRAGLLARLLPK